MIAIIGAMDVETQLLINKLQNYENLMIAGKQFYVGTLCNQKVVIARCGIGKVNAAMITQILISEFEVDLILNTGVAGALDDGINVKDVVVATDLVYHDFDTTYFQGDILGQVPGLDTFSFPADKEVVERLLKSAKSVLDKECVHTGRIVSGDQFVADFKKKGTIKIYFGAVAVEMESAAVAHVCYLNKVPFGIIRCISDNANKSADIDFNQFVQDASMIGANIVMNFLENL